MPSSLARRRKEYQDAWSRLFKEKKFDYSIETLPAPPKGEVGKGEGGEAGRAGEAFEEWT